MSILICKDLSAWLTNCKGDKVKQIQNDVQIVQLLDTNVILEEGIVLGNIIDFLYHYGICPLVIEQFGRYQTFATNIDETYEYISLTPKYNLDIKNNGVHIVDKSYNILNIETSDGDSMFIFDYMVTKQVIDLEIRIEREIIEYNNAKFFMPADITLRELILTISDGIIES